MQSIVMDVAGPEYRNEPVLSRQPILSTAADKRESFRQSPYLPVLATGPRLFPEDKAAAPRLRRRASQGSVRTKPSSVARFLRRGNFPLQLPFASLGIKSGSTSPQLQARSLPADVRLRLHTSCGAEDSTDRQSRSAPAGESGSAFDEFASSDCSSHLPPTPPEDEEHGWSHPNAHLSLFDMYHQQGSRPLCASLRSPHGRKSEDLSSPPNHIDNGRSSSAGSPTAFNDEMDCDPPTGSWLEHSIEATVSALSICNPRGEAVKIVSQMLPYPQALDKLVKFPTQDSVFTSIVHATHTRLQPGQSPYINITHAVPEQFTLSNLPSSPPTTPRLHGHGEDYFNLSIFANAAAVPAYHDSHGSLQTQPSHAPVPIVPPHSVHVSILERYLPPASVSEYRDMFCAGRPSFLVDRLCELSPNGGSMLFIYPTKKGASTFKTQYLGPILDPLLRQLVVVNELSADVSRCLGRLNAVSQMDDFDTMKAAVTQLCQSMSSPGSQFALVDSGRGGVHLDRSVWSEWYIHQEKARLKEVLSTYWQNGRRPSGSGTSPTGTGSNRMLTDKEVTSSMLLGEIFEGVRRRPYGAGDEPRDAIELGVFVIRRTT